MGKNNTATTTTLLKVSLDLEEDLHTGSGTGTMEIDSLQARDERGRPCIPREHYKGLLALAAGRLQKGGAIGGDMKAQLFGQEGGQQGGLVIVPTLRTDTNIKTLIWTEVARRPGHRDALDDTLRTVEYVPAGSKFEGTFRFRRLPDACEIEALKKCIRHVKRMGRSRTRGSGAVYLAPKPQAEVFEATARPSIKNDTGRIRLILKSEEPVCIPTTGVPGNVIRSHSFLPGAVLNGALSAWGDAHGMEPLFYRSGLAITNAYPLPAGFDLSGECNPDWLQVLPMPLNQYRPKGEGNPDDIDWPHWAPGYETVGDAGRPFFDRLSDGKKAGKRPKGHPYLFSADKGSNWKAYSVALGIQMRNRRGDPVELDRKEDTDLFSVQMVPAGRYFLCDITGDFEALKQFATSHAALFDSNARACITVGRGGAPVTIVKRLFLRDVPLPVANRTAENELQITLTSDLIATAPKNLGQHTQWNPATLRDLLKEADAGVRDLLSKNGKTPPISDTEFIGSFNAASGLPRPPVTALRRGSVLRLQADNDEDRKALRTLKKTLQDRAKKGRWLGERVQEGFGRYVLDCEPEPRLAFSGACLGSAGSGVDELPGIEKLARLASSQSKLPKPSAYKMIGMLAAQRSLQDFDKAVENASDELKRQAKDGHPPKDFEGLVDQYCRSLGESKLDDLMQFIKMVIEDECAD